MESGEFSRASCHVDYARAPPTRLRARRHATCGVPGIENCTAEASSRVEVPAPFEEPLPSRFPSFPKMVLLDTAHVLTSPFHWRGREWFLLSASTAAVAALTLADETVSDAARERGPTLGFFGDAVACSVLE